MDWVDSRNEISLKPSEDEIAESSQKTKECIKWEHEVIPYRENCKWREEGNNSAIYGELHAPQYDQRAEEMQGNTGQKMR